MKNFIIIISLLATGLESYSQQSNVIKFNAGALLEKSFSIGFERTLTEMSAFQVNIDYHTEKDQFLYFQDRYTGFGLYGEYRVYGLIPAINVGDHKALNGFFVGPTAAYRSVTYKSLDAYEEFKDRVYVIQAGAVAGYQWLPKSVKRLSLEASIAAVAGISFSEDDGLYFDNYFGIGPRFDSGISPVFSLNVGYTFGK